MSTDYADAMAAALAYTDDVGLSDGTDRPLTTAPYPDRLAAELIELGVTPALAHQAAHQPHPLLACTEAGISPTATRIAHQRAQ